jgi:hypothetical protein
MTYYTHYRKMAAPHCVYGDVSSDSSANEMIYYTHYMKMATADYICPDVVS